jgi:hypothetical protein
LVNVAFHIGLLVFYTAFDREADILQIISAVQQKKGSECKLTSESISNATTTNEQLRSLVSNQRARRDEYANATSHQLQGINLNLYHGSSNNSVKGYRII